MSYPSGRHFLQIPGPSPVPDRILRAMSLPTIDHRGPEFGALGLKVLDGLKQVFQTRHPVAIYPASGTGAWEAALANTMSPGDAVLMFETGHFATLWQKMATAPAALQAGVPSPRATGANGWRRGVQADLIEQRCAQTLCTASRRCAWCTTKPPPGVTSDIAAVRRAIDAARPPGAADGRHHLARWPAPTTGTTNGASTCRSAARRRG